MKNKLKLVVDKCEEIRIPGGIIYGQYGDIIYFKLDDVDKWLGGYSFIYKIEGLRLYVGLRVDNNKAEVFDYKDGIILKTYDSIIECTADILIKYDRLLILYRSSGNNNMNSRIRTLIKLITLGRQAERYVVVEGSDIIYRGLLDVSICKWLIRPDEIFGDIKIDEQETIRVDPYNIVLYVRGNYVDIFKIVGKELVSLLHTYDGIYNTVWGRSGNSYILKNRAIYYNDRNEIIYCTACDYSKVRDCGYYENYDIHYVLYELENGDVKLCIYNSDICYDFITNQDRHEEYLVDKYKVKILNSRVTLIVKLMCGDDEYKKREVSRL